MRLDTNHLRADGAILLTTIIWGSTFVIASDILGQWPPLSYLALRMGVAALVFVALFPKRVAGAGREVWKAGATLGLLMGVGLIGQTVGLLYTTPSKSAFITGLTTPLVPFIAYALLRTRPGKENLLGVVLASVGGALILAPADAGGFNTGDLITLACITLFAAHITLMSIYARRHDVRQLSILQVTVIAALTGSAWLAVWASGAALGGERLPAALARELEPLVWDARVAWQLVYLSLVATVATFLLWTWGQARMSATHASIIFSLEPVFATLFAVLWRGTGQWMGGRGNAGALLVLAGIIVSELRWGEAGKAGEAGPESEEGVRGGADL